jgi:hypothetical protein
VPVNATVNPTPVIADKAYTICSGTSFTYASETGDVVPANTEYTWTVADNANVTGESAQTTATGSMSQTLTNTSATAQDVVYTVTPAGDCTGDPFTVTVTVNPKPVVTVTPAADVCSSESVDLAATFSSSVAGAAFTYYTDAACTSPASVTTIAWDGSAADQTLDQTTTLYAVATANGCTSDPSAASTVTIKHKPAAPTVEGINACPSSTSIIKTWASLVTGKEATATLTWYDGASVVTPADFDLKVEMSKTYSVTQTVNGCESEKANVSVVISNTLQIQALQIS